MNFYGHIITLKYLLLGTIFVLSSSLAQARNFTKTNPYYTQCQEIKKFLVKPQEMKILCNPTFHHYNIEQNTIRTETSDPIRLASFNLWHPGQHKSIFKDYKLMAKMMNQWDLIAALEVQAVIGSDLENNNSVTKLIEQTPNKIAVLQEKLKVTTAPKERELLKQRIKKLRHNMRLAPKLYRAPGYLKLLRALRKLDPSWSFILSANGEAARPTNVQELVGFFYRGSIVQPKRNSYCALANETLEPAYACTVSFNGTFLPHEYQRFIARRPFIASFKSGHFEFTYISSHFVFNSPRDPHLKQEILRKIFNVKTIEELGPGAYPSNYARLAEFKIIMQFLEKYKEEFPQEKIIFGGDFNLTTDNPFVRNLLKDVGHNNWLLKVNTPTTTKFRRYNSDGSPTNGLANDYDHFIIHKENSNCLNQPKKWQPQSYNFFTEKFMKRKIERKYKIRIEKKNPSGYYMVSEARQRKGKALYERFKTKWMKRQTIKNGQIVIDSYKQQKTILDFKRRVLDSQLQDRTYWRYFIEVLSDHLPIFMGCTKTSN